MRHYGNKDGELFQNLLNFHKCTPSELEEFYPVDIDWKASYERRRRNNGLLDLYCIEIDDSINISGKASSNDFQKLEIIFAPCNYIHTSFGYEDKRPVPDTCVSDLDKIKDYLGNIQLTVLYNDEEFDQSKYGAAAIRRSSKMFIKQLNPSEPTVYNLFL